MIDDRHTKGGAGGVFADVNDGYRRVVAINRRSITRFIRDLVGRRQQRAASCQKT